MIVLLLDCMNDVYCVCQQQLYPAPNKMDTELNGQSFLLSVPCCPINCVSTSCSVLLSSHTMATSFIRFNLQHFTWFDHLNFKLVLLTHFVGSFIDQIWFDHCILFATIFISSSISLRITLTLINHRCSENFLGKWVVNVYLCLVYEWFLMYVVCALFNKNKHFQIKSNRGNWNIHQNQFLKMKI